MSKDSFVTVLKGWAHKTNFIMQAFNNNDITRFDGGLQTSSFSCCADLIAAMRCYIGSDD